MSRKFSVEVKLIVVSKNKGIIQSRNNITRTMLLWVAVQHHHQADFFNSTKIPLIQPVYTDK